MFFLFIIQMFFCCQCLASDLAVSSTRPLGMTQLTRREIDSRRMEFLMQEAFTKSKIKDIKGKDVILFLGNTQIGKSTLINYLLGCRYSDKEIQPRLIVGTELAQRGTGTGSVTLYPEVFNVPDTPLYLCDTQGFGDSRGREEIIVSSILLEMIVNAAGNVKIVIPFSEQQLDMAGSGIRDFCRTMDKLLASREADMFFVYNRTDPRWKLETCCRKIDELLEQEYRRLEELSRQAGGSQAVISYFISGIKKFFSRSGGTEPGSSQSSYENQENLAVSHAEDVRRLMDAPAIRDQHEKIETLWLLQKMQTIDRARILHVDIFDEGESARTFFERTRPVYPVSKQNFRFNRLSEFRPLFDSLTCRLLNDFKAFLQLKNSFGEYGKYVFERAEHLENYRSYLDFERERLGKNLRQGILPQEMEVTVSQLDRKKQELELSRTRNTEQREAIQANINKIEDDDCALSAKPHPVVYKTIAWKDVGTYVFGWYWWAQYNLTYNDSDIKFSEFREKLGQDTKRMKVVTENKDAGTLAIVYGTDYKNLCAGEVEILVERADLESTKIEIENFRTKRRELVEQHERFTARIEQCEKDIASLQSIVNSKKQEGMVLLQERIADLEQRTREVEDNIQKLFHFLEIIGFFKSYDMRAIDTWFLIYENLLNSGVQSANSLIAQQFLKEYKRQEELQPVSSAVDCPVLFDEFEKWVRLPCGHALSEEAYRKLDPNTQSGRVCPCCRESFVDKREHIFSLPICELQFDDLRRYHIDQIESLIGKYIQTRQSNATFNSQLVA